MWQPQLELIVGGEVGEADRDGVWALTSPEVYLLLVESSGWTVDQYEAWMSEMLERVVPRSPSTGKDSSMTTKAEAPADTSMMRIVHSALRRDLQRAQSRSTTIRPHRAANRSRSPVTSSG